MNGVSRETLAKVAVGVVLAAAVLVTALQISTLAAPAPLGATEQPPEPAPPPAVPVAPNGDPLLPVEPGTLPDPSALAALPGPLVRKAQEVTHTPRPADPGAAADARPPWATPDFAADARLLTEAQSVLLDDPAKALALCDQHAKRYPDSRLAQEREVVAIAALVALGRGADARDRERAFEDTYPGSPQTRRVQRIVSSP